MQDFRVKLKNAPAFKAGMYLSLRLAQLRRLIARGGNAFLRLFAAARLEIGSLIREIFGKFRRWFLVFLMSLGGNLVRNESLVLADRQKGRHFLVPRGMTFREAAAPILSNLPAHVRHRLFEQKWGKIGRPVALGFIVVFAVIVMASQFYGLAVEIYVGGRYLGAVEDETVYAEAAALCENEARRSLGQLYTLNVVPTYSLGVASAEEILTADELSQLLFAQIDEVQELYTMTVDGVIYGAVTDRTMVDEFLEQFLASRDPGEPDTRVAFAQNIEFEKRTVSLKYYMEPTELIAALSGFKTEATTYTLRKGDTLSAVALRNGMTLSELVALNPGVDVNGIRAGEEIFLNRSVPVLQVDTCILQTYEEVIPYETEEIKDKTLYVGQTRTKQKGKNGSKIVTAYVTYRDGEVVKRDVVTETVTQEPVKKIVRVGTRSRKSGATGTFQWPCSGVVTSTYGSRPSRGDFHTGIDIANRKGTPIYAADGGTVVLVKKLNYSYGYYLRIKHDNTGYETLYAHCSEILVEEGQRVNKGQVIAKMGSTGNSTGNHLHLEIIKNGQKINPRPLLP